VVTYIGFLDVTDFVDVWPLASPWTGFSNLAFSTGAASMALPNDATFGAMLGSWLGDEFYVIGSITDMNSNPRDPFDGIKTFFNTNEYYTSVELGWTPSKGEFYSDNVHVTFWHVDAVTATSTPDGWGMNFSIVHWVDDTWMPFFRGGWAEDGGSLLESSLNAGVVIPAGKDSDDIIGTGVHWGRPNATTFGPGLGDQTSIEMFYRAQVTQNFRLTPSIQLLFDPALNPAQDLVPVFGMRGVMSF
jgi:porin